MKLNKRDIRQGYYGVKKLAEQAFAEGDFLKTMDLIKHCATVAQQFNWIYKDDELESLIEKISAKIIEKQQGEYKPIHNRVVFYDEFCVSFILAIQYLDALVEAGCEIVYVTFESKRKKYQAIFDYVEKMPNTTLVLLEENDMVKANQLLYERIVESKPEKLILHICGTSSMMPAISALPPEISSYLINLADQTFWLGAKFIDYVFEFRQFGVSVSQQRRGIKPEQQLLVPFYPVVDGNEFQGFPAECTEPNKVLVFSGSDIYKVLDSKGMYWHLVKRILDSFPEVVFLFATKGDCYGIDFIQDFIRKNGFENRFIYTKFRPDINEVFAHADIYMGTCPVSGSLMSQLAARNATPILQYYYPGTPDDETEQAICVNEEFQISFRNEDDFMKEAARLVYDKTYRKKQGERIKAAMVSVRQFNEFVKNSLATNKTQLPLKPYHIDYDMLDDRWLELENCGYISSMNYLYGLLGARKCFFYSTGLFLKKNINRLVKHVAGNKN